MKSFGVLKWFAYADVNADTMVVEDMDTCRLVDTMISCEQK